MVDDIICGKTLEKIKSITSMQHQNHWYKKHTKVLGFKVKRELFNTLFRLPGLVIVLLFIWTVYQLPPDRSIQAYSGLCAVSAFIILTSQKPKCLEHEFPIWFFLFYFVIAYYLKGIILYSYRDAFVDNSLRVFRFYAFNNMVMGEVAYLINISFFAFCICSYLLLQTRKVKNEHIHKKKSVLLQGHSFNKSIRQKFFHLFIIFFIIYLFSAYISFKLGISVMGAAGVKLPFRLSGFMFYYRLITFPCLIITGIWLSDLPNRKDKYYTFYFVVLVFYILFETIIRASRGVVFFTPFLLFLMFLFSGRMTLSRLKFIVVGMLLAVFSYVFITIYRFAIMADKDALESLKVYAVGNNLFFILLHSMTEFFHRIPGVESLIAVIGSGIQALGFEAFSIFSFLGGEGINNYASRFVFEINQDAHTGSAAGFMGFFKIVGGNMLCVLGPALVILFYWKIWNKIYFSKLKIKPIALCMFFYIGSLSAMNGSFDALLGLRLIVTITTVVFLEVFIRSNQQNFVR